MKKIINLLIIFILTIGMVGCNDNKFDKIENYIIEKYGYSENMIYQYEDTKFIAIKIPTVEGNYPMDDLEKYAEQKQNEIQLDVWNLGYHDVAITVCFINIEDDSIIYVAKADDIYYQRNN